MKHFLACLTLCASLSASAQGDNCTVLGIQDLTQMVFDLQAQLNAQDATIDSLQNAAMTRDGVIAIAIHKQLSIDEVTIGDLGTINLGFADLSGAYLSRADLSNADLFETNLSGADLSRADLSRAYLFETDLSGANLSRADLSNADLFGADLSGAIMSCLISCPVSLPSGYICEPYPGCAEPDRYRIVPN